MNLKKIILVWRAVYSKPAYVISAVLIAIFFYILNALIQNASYKIFYITLQEQGIFAAFSLLFKLTLGLVNTLDVLSFISLFLIGILLGMLFTLIFFKTRALSDSKSKKSGILASIGIFLGIAAPGCAACSVGLLSLLGIGAGFLTLLPLKGLELSIIAVLILAFEVYYVSKNLLTCEACKVKLK